MSKKPKAPAPLSNKAVDALYGIAEEIYEELDGGQIPKMKIPLRTKANIRFDPKHAVWKYGSLMGVRSAKKLKGALMLLRTMHVLEFIRDMIRELKRLRITVLLVEQNARVALSVCDRGYIMEKGSIVFEGLSAELRDSPTTREKLGV